MMPRIPVTVTLDEKLLAQIDSARSGVVPRSKIMELALSEVLGHEPLRGFQDLQRRIARFQERARAQQKASGPRPDPEATSFIERETTQALQSASGGFESLEKAERAAKERAMQTELARRRRGSR